MATLPLSATGSPWIWTFGRGAFNRLSLMHDDIKIQLRPHCLCPVACAEASTDLHTPVHLYNWCRLFTRSCCMGSQSQDHAAAPLPPNEGEGTGGRFPHVAPVLHGCKVRRDCGGHPSGAIQPVSLRTHPPYGQSFTEGALEATHHAMHVALTELALVPVIALAGVQMRLGMSLAGHVPPAT